MRRAGLIIESLRRDGPHRGAIDRRGAESRVYTYPGLSDLVRQRLRFRRLSGGEAPRAAA